jgi:signal peptidase II
VNPRLIAFSAVALILLLDQWTKALVRAAWPENASKTVIQGFFNLVHAENPGAAFSMLADASPLLRGLVLIGIALLVAAFLVAALFGKFGIVTSPVSRWAVTLILGGAVGNLIDRIRFGTVTDFLEFYIGNYYWPAFNVADSAIFCGAVLLFADYWMQSRKPRPAEAEAVSPTEHVS